MLCRVSHSTKKARQTVHRQNLIYRLLFLGHSAQRFAEQPLGDGVMETASLPSVCPAALGKKSIVAECHLGHSAKSPPGRVPMSGSLPSARCGTRQNVPLCRVPAILHSAKSLTRCPGLCSLPSVMTLTLGKAPLGRVPRIWHSAKLSLSSVRRQILGKAWPLGFLKNICRVPHG
jgi:hypothetical protein